MSIQELLEGRFSQSEKAKVQALAKQSAEGALSSFSGLFKPTALSTSEKEAIQELLYTHQQDEEQSSAKDAEMLIRITAEIKAIHNQACLLHGERIAAAQKLLKQYKDGAFSLWLIATYGNRQTPYNFLLYYEFYQQLSSELRALIETMPRQAVYTLASRSASLEEKKALISTYKGETKQEMLDLIRQTFPLAPSDKRKEEVGQKLVLDIETLVASFNKKKHEMTKEERQEVALCLRKFLFFVESQN
jgi:hypothetical protein